MNALNSRVLAADILASIFLPNSSNERKERQKDGGKNMASRLAFPLSRFLLSTFAISALSLALSAFSISAFQLHQVGAHCGGGLIAIARRKTRV